MKRAKIIARSEAQRNADVQTNAIFGASQPKNRSGSKKLRRQNRIFLASRKGVRGFDDRLAGCGVAAAGVDEAGSPGDAELAGGAVCTRPCAAATSRNWSISSSSIASPKRV